MRSLTFKSSLNKFWLFCSNTSTLKEENTSQDKRKQMQRAKCCVLFPPGKILINDLKLWNSTDMRKYCWNRSTSETCLEQSCVFKHMLTGPLSEIVQIHEYALRKGVIYHLLTAILVLCIFMSKKVLSLYCLLKYQLFPSLIHCLLIYFKNSLIFLS